MIGEQFTEIKNRAWSLCKANMQEWTLKTIKDFDKAPQWVKDSICTRQGGECIDFEFVIDCDDNKLLEKYNTQIETMLEACQMRNFDVNYTREMLGFFESQRDGDEYGMIKAICNMIVLSLKARGYRGHSYSEFTNENLIKPLVYRDIEVRSLLFELEDRGYDSYKCMLETMKEFESYAGSWNEQEGKMCKGLGAHTLNEALKKSEDIMECGFVLSFCLLKEDDEFWLIGDDDESFDEEQNLDEIKKDFCGHCVKVKKWYKADYAECKKVSGEPL